jgi:hypothetical protein
MNTWDNKYYNLFNYQNSDNVVGAGNGRSEFDGYWSDASLLQYYGSHWGTAIAYTFIWTSTSDPCSQITESDIIWNAAFNFTTNPAVALDNPNVVNLNEINVHEMGHSWGLQRGIYKETYDYDYLSVMHYYYNSLVEDGLAIHWVDNNLLRRDYPALTGYGHNDMGIESYYAQDGLHNSTIDNSEYAPGETITVHGFSVENIDISSIPNVRVSFYLSHGRRLTPGVHYNALASYNWSVFAFSSTYVGDFSSHVPFATPGGHYYIVAVVTVNGQADGIPANDTTSIHDDIYISPTISGTVLDQSSQPVPNVVIDGSGQSLITDAQGHYQFVSTYGQSVTLTPQLDCYSFTPSQTLIAMTASQIANYSGLLSTPHLIGSVKFGTTPLQGVQFTGDPNLKTTSGNSGAYRLALPCDWNGEVVPQKSGYIFTPTSAQVSNASGTIVQNFQATSTVSVTTSPTSDVASKLYPNPTSGKFTITLPSDFGKPVQLIVLDEVGKTVRDVTKEATLDGLKVTCNLQSLVEGVYFFRIEGATRSLQYKLVVKK